MITKANSELLVLTAVGLLIVGLGFFAGVTAGGSSAPVSLSANSGLRLAATDTDGSFNFSNSGPVWDSGNLCVVQTVGTFVICDYSGSSGSSGHYGGTAQVQGMSGCGCHRQYPLIYNFSVSHVTLNVSLTDLSSNVPIYINIEGSHNTINVNVTGCRGGGSLNLSVLGEFDDVYFANSANRISSTFAIYENHDGYFAQISGNGDRTTTYFSGAAPKHNLCPWNNGTRSMSWSVSITGWWDSQSFVWASGYGYNTAPNQVNLGNWNSEVFENTSSFTCYWSIPTPSTCQGGMGMGPAILATSRD